jgi:hypothetical protein
MRHTSLTLSGEGVGPAGEIAGFQSVDLEAHEFKLLSLYHKKPSFVFDLATNRRSTMVIGSSDAMKIPVNA